MDEDAALLEVVHLELLRCVLALNRARLHAVELDCGLGEVHAGDAGPEAPQDDGFEQIRVGGIDVQRGVGRLGVIGHEAERGEGREEVQS